jgi:hypothetical protein
MPSSKIAPSQFAEPWLFRVLTMFMLAALVSGCQTTGYFGNKNFKPSVGERKILVMTPDVELSELSASGISILKADWTQSAQGHILEALTGIFGEREASLVSYRKNSSDVLSGSRDIQLIKLHEAVGLTIRAHQLGTALRLPNKGDTFDWTLGPDVQSLQKKYSSEYALFLNIRDSYTGGGRAAVMVGAALLGVSLQGGVQSGFASLVDLKSGDIIWFNVLFRGHGDLREYKPAEETIRALLKNFPK